MEDRTEGSSTCLVVPPSIFGLDAKWLNPKTSAQSSIPKFDLPLSSSEDSGSLLDFLQAPKLDKDCHVFPEIAQVFTLALSEEARVQT